MEPQPAVSVRSVNFVRTFPWLRLGQAIGCALAPQQVAIGIAVAVLLAVLQSTVFVSERTRPEIALTYDDQYAVSLSNVIRPVTDVWQPLWLMQAVRSSPALRITEAIVIFLLWTLGGVAIARCAAIQFCRDENPSLRGAVQWSFTRALGSTTAVLTPLGGAAILLLIVALLALPGGVPALGLMWTQVAAPVLLLLGVFAGFVLLLLPVLWPLMVAAVAVDGSDAFDAFSRSFSLVTSKLWSTLGLLLLVSISALVLTLGFRLVLDAGVAATVWAVAWTTTDTTTSSLARVLTWWREAGLRGLCGSLFWTHAAIVYLFLREQVDAVPVFVLAGYSEDHRPHELYPVVGIPAATPAAAPTEPPFQAAGEEGGPEQDGERE